VKRWICYYLIPLAILIILIFLPYSGGEDGVASFPSAPARYQEQRTVEASTPLRTELPSPALDPRGQIVEINYRDPSSGAYKPMSEGSVLPLDVYHFNGKVRNTCNESVLVYLDVIQHQGPTLIALGAGEWLLAPGQEVFLFVQGADMKTADRTYRLSFVLKERGTNRILDEKTINVTTR
jgi:hypothetical protein